MKISGQRTSENPDDKAANGSLPIDSEPPLFIVGCGRSGTTLVRMMLNTHPELAIPTESHFIYELARRRLTGSWSGRIDDDTAWRDLLDYFDGHHYLGLWKLNTDRLHRRLARISSRTHAAVFEVLFREFMEQEGKQRWGDKTPLHVQYILLLDHLFPNARFLHVIRDGRDVEESGVTCSTTSMGTIISVCGS